MKALNENRAEVDDMSEWKPIATAPADVELLLYSPAIGSWREPRIEIRLFWDTQARTRHAWATHWMPLPDPPAEEHE